MSNHTTRVVGSEGAWQAKCECKARSPIVDHQWEADDWKRAHMQIVERVRLHLKPTPSLKDQRDWYRKQAAQATDEPTRDQWLLLADGLDHRLGTVPEHDDSLF